MTQDYEPIEITEGTPEPNQLGIYLLIDMEGHVETSAKKTELHGDFHWAIDGSIYSWPLLVCYWSRFSIQSLAAHDAQIQAEEPKITFGNDEAIAFTRAMFKELGHYAFFDLAFDDAQDAYENAFANEENGQYGFDAIEAGIKAVNQLRETSREEQKQ